MLNRLATFIILSLLPLNFCSASSALVAENIIVSKEFTAQELRLSDIIVSGKIETSNNNKINVEFYGPNNVIEKIDATQHRSKLLISTDKISPEEAQNLKINIKAPTSTILDLQILGDTKWEIEKIRSTANIIMKGDNELKIKEVRAPNLAIDFTGDNHINIRNGNISKAKLKMLGDNKASIDADIQDLTLNLVGNNKVKLSKIPKQTTYEKNLGVNSVKINK